MTNNNGPFAANRAQEALSRAFTWALQCGYIDRSPMFGLKPLSKEPSRDRVLQLDELVSIWKASSGLGEYGTIIRVILTGCRRAVVGDLSWREINLDARLWTLPPERTKNGRAHKIPLSDQALVELQGIEPRADRLFGRNKRNGFSGWVRNKRLLDEASCVGGWVVHDIRRSVVTHLSDMGFDTLTIELIVNHRSGVRAGVAGIYDRSQRMP